jgi:hypothetical protein
MNGCGTQGNLLISSLNRTRSSLFVYEWLLYTRKLVDLQSEQNQIWIICVWMVAPHKETCWSPWKNIHHLTQFTLWMWIRNSMQHKMINCWSPVWTEPDINYLCMNGCCTQGNLLISSLNRTSWNSVPNLNARKTSHEFSFWCSKAAVFNLGCTKTSYGVRKIESKIYYFVINAE